MYQSEEVAGSAGLEFHCLDQGPSRIQSVGNAVGLGGFLKERTQLEKESLEEVAHRRAKIMIYID